MDKSTAPLFWLWGRHRFREKQSGVPCVPIYAKDLHKVPDNVSDKLQEAIDKLAQEMA